MLLSALYLYGISRELRLSWLHVMLSRCRLTLVCLIISTSPLLLSTSPPYAYSSMLRSSYLKSIAGNLKWKGILVLWYRVFFLNSPHLSNVEICVHLLLPLLLVLFYYFLWRTCITQVHTQSEHPVHLLRFYTHTLHIHIGRGGGTAETSRWGPPPRAAHWLEGYVWNNRFGTNTSRILAKEVNLEVRSSPRDVHLLPPLLLVLFSVAHLHCRTYAVHMNNSYLPLVCIHCSIPPCHWKTSCQLSKCPLAVISCRGGDTKECHSSRPAQ